MNNIDRMVQVLSLDKRYRMEPYPVMAPFSQSLGIYLTGQHRIPSNEEYSDGLTLDEMTGKTEIKPLARRNKFEYVINPFDVHPILHGRRFNLSIENGVIVNQKDWWEFKFFTEFAKTYNDSFVVATSKNNYINGRNYFYVNDKEAVAIEMIKEVDNYAEALFFIREKAIEDYRSVALLLNYYIEGYNIDPDRLSSNQLRHALYEACKSNPEKVIRCDNKVNPNVNKELFFLNLASYGIIQYDPSKGFYSQEVPLIGGNLTECMIFANKEDNQTLIAKWGALLREKQKTVKSPYELVNK